MSYTRKYDTRIHAINERIHEFLKTKHLTGQVEHEFQPGNLNMATGWVILTVGSADPKLHHELNSVISNLERINAAQSEWMPETEPNLSDYSYRTLQTDMQPTAVSPPSARQSSHRAVRPRSAFAAAVP